MRTVRTVAELRALVRAARHNGERVGLVPTMGALHEGHLSLVRAARADCGLVVVSLFVNPAQFNESSDLERYPRDEQRDSRLAAEAGADVLFAPAVEEVYPAGFATTVEVLGLTDRLEGAVRGASHFRGVTTVVAKLLGMVAPDVAYFGAKDAQQVVVVRRMVTDLDMGVEIRALPIVREPDGLAMSSRNVLLDPAAREQALALSEGLLAAVKLARLGERSGRALRAAVEQRLAAREVEADYVALVHSATLEPLGVLSEEGLLAVAARVGGVRLIDNVTLTPVAGTRAGLEASACSA